MAVVFHKKLRINLPEGQGDIAALAADATIADRMRKIPIGLLAREAGRAAIAKPFANLGMNVDDGVEERLAAWADNNPYFLQLVGETAWTEAAQFGWLTSEAAEAAIERVRVPRDEYYFRRYKELAAEGHLEFGVEIARIVRDGGNRIMEVTTEMLARQHCGEGWKAAADFIIQKGFLWREGAGREYQTGIPSLMDYTIDRYEAEYGHEAGVALAPSGQEENDPDDPLAMPAHFRPPSPEF